MLDAAPLGLLSNPLRTPAARECGLWLAALVDAGVRVYLPEIADYEVRRELLRARKTASVVRLDVLKRQAFYVPITTPAMLLAAEFWASARQQGRPTAPNERLDADVILAAQAATLIDPDLVVATSNPAHLGRYVPALPWREIL